MRGAVTSLAFTPDGQTLAAGSDHGIVSLWRRNTTLPFGTPAANPGWQQYREFPGRRGWINSLCFAPSHPLLFAAADDALIITHRID